MAARAESFCIPGKEDAISEQMYEITVKVIQQTLAQNLNYQPVVTTRENADPDETDRHTWNSAATGRQREVRATRTCAGLR